ncbi:MAG: ATP-dependent DNA helicase RecG [Prochlorotrichaceae cyanobacterium]
MSAPQSSQLDWSRLQQALTFEVDRHFNDVQGKQYRFSEFLSLQLQAPPESWQSGDREKLRDLSDRFQGYADLSYADRQHLVAETRRTLHQLRSTYQTPESKAGESFPSSAQPSPSVKTPKTAPLNSPSHHTSQVLPVTTALSQVNGVGPRTATLLQLLDLYTIHDILSYYPRDYLDYARQLPIRDLQEGETATVIGTVKRCNCFTSPKNKKLSIFELIMTDRSGELRLSRFWAGMRYTNKGWQEAQKKLYPPGATIAASGLVKRGKRGKTLDNPQIEVLDHGASTIESSGIGRIVPVYSLTEGVSGDLVRRTVIAALPSVQTMVDPLPESLRQTYELMDFRTAIAQIHFPESQVLLDQARHRLVFDEFFYLQLGLLRRQRERQQLPAQVFAPQSGSLVDQFYQQLPFQLTGAQQRVVSEILQDLEKPSPMNRLVQGDVGAGKTIVAVIALLVSIQCGFQGALMAPTEVLAEQHYRKLVTWLNPLCLSVELLTGSTRAAKRREILEHLETGQLPLLVGTHALIQPGVNFQKLGLVVIDEQHRFGVEQRAKLQAKGNNPHLLSMTATPIPRTLALTLHGDLEVSQIDELPPGRQAIQTTLLTPSDRPHAYDLIRREIAKGQQVYVVLPLVEESEKIDLKSAIEEHKQLKEQIFPEFEVGLLHGRMSSAEKDEAIQAFRAAKTQILVSTTVVEVGVDIPNATVMLIEHAERFGLSQLHQLRGRVGRGSAQSFCLLLSDSRSDTAAERLQVLEQSQDGFFIAEMDLRLRGPGQVLGTRQSGLPDFALANLVLDQEVLEIARQAAETLLSEDQTLNRWPGLKQSLNDRYQKLMGGLILT